MSFSIKNSPMPMLQGHAFAVSNLQVQPMLNPLTTLIQNLPSVRIGQPLPQLSMPAFRGLQHFAPMPRPNMSLGFAGFQQQFQSNLAHTGLWSGIAPQFGGAFGAQGMLGALNGLAGMMWSSLSHAHMNRAQMGMGLNGMGMMHQMPQRPVTQNNPTFQNFSSQYDALMKGGDYSKIGEFGKKNLFMEWTGAGWKDDHKTTQTFLQKMKDAKVDIKPTALGKTPPKSGAGKLNFTATEAQSIQQALLTGGDAAARKQVLNILSKKSGEPIFDDPQALDREFSSRKYGYEAKTKYDHLSKEQLAKPDILTSNTRALNKLFGTKVPAAVSEYKNREKTKDGKPIDKVGHGNKRGLSTFVLTQLADSIVQGMKRSVGKTQVAGSFVQGHFQGAMPGWIMGGAQMMGGMYGLEIPAPAQAFSVDASSYLDGIKTVAQLSTPLIFDLEGTGFKVKDSKLVPFDIDNDGEEELISDLKDHALLIFDSQTHDEDGQGQFTGRDVFGGHTDLSAYGVEHADGDVFEDGFVAFHTLLAHFSLIDAKKRYIDTSDLQLLEEKVGLRLRVGGLIEGVNYRFEELGITRINIGDASQTERLESCQQDMWLNRIMRQPGSTFIIQGKEREYADLWFNIQAREKKEGKETQKDTLHVRFSAPQRI